MNHFDLIIKDADSVFYFEPKNKMLKETLSIGIRHGRIASLNTSTRDSAEKTISLKGLTLFPGLIDSQVHFREPGLTHKEDILSGTTAALCGGITTVFEMPNTNPSTTTAQDFEKKIELAKQKAKCHYAFFIGGSATNIDDLHKLERLPHCAGIKVFLGSSFGHLLVDDDQVFHQIMKAGHRRVIIHAEDEKRLKERKSIVTESRNVRDHHIWRDEQSALLATQKSVNESKLNSRPIHILHVSSAEEMQYLSEQKKQTSPGQITVEILPQYLTLSAPECYERLGTLAQQNPPIRDKRHLEHLWKAVLDGTVDVIGSDHAPHTLEEKNKPYPESPSGVPGVQTLLPIMLNEVNKGRLPLERLVQLLSENPRRVFKVKNKGRLQEGYDADLTIVDLKRTEEIKKSWLKSKSNWSPYEGLRVTGWPVMSYLKGELAMAEAELQNTSLASGVEFE